MRVEAGELLGGESEATPGVIAARDTLAWQQGRQGQLAAEGIARPPTGGKYLVWWHHRGRHLELGNIGKDIQRGQFAGPVKPGGPHPLGGDAHPFVAQQREATRLQLVVSQIGLRYPHVSGAELEGAEEGMVVADSLSLDAGLGQSPGGFVG